MDVRMQPAHRAAWPAACQLRPTSVKQTHLSDQLPKEPAATKQSGFCPQIKTLLYFPPNLLRFAFYLDTHTKKKILEFRT